MVQRKTMYFFPQASGKPAETLWSATSSGSWIKENVKVSGERDFTLHFIATQSRGKVSQDFYYL